MIVKIRLENFEPEVLAEKGPVLLACIHWGSGYGEQVKILDDVSENFRDALKVSLIDKDFIGAIKEKLEIEGTPTFIFFDKGEEKDRMLGQADRETITAFVMRNLP